MYFIEIIVICRFLALQFYTKVSAFSRMRLCKTRFLFSKVWASSLEFGTICVDIIELPELDIGEELDSKILECWSNQSLLKQPLSGSDN